MARPRLLAQLLLALVLGSTCLPAQRFYKDDPLHAEPPPRSVGKILGRKFSDYFDFFISTFGNPTGADQKSPAPPAQAVNTLGEPMDSAWWQRRHYYKPMSIEELLRGPGNTSPPSTEGKWLVVSAKNEGITPGFKIEDSKGDTYHIKFDPHNNPEIATAPDVLVSKLFYALGYNVPENYIVAFDIDQIEIAQGTRLTDRLGKSREMTRRDVTEIMLNVPVSRDGKFRAVASRTIEGEWAGPFRYWGTRKDDPNDVVPHEHRRDLRGLSVACAWVNHDDSRAINTIDFVASENERRFVKHYLIDFGSTLGSATEKANSPRSGSEYVWEFKPAMLQFFTFGLVVPEWARAKYPNYPSVGLFEHEKFDPLRWKPEYPNPAFMNALPDDSFWMAKQIMSLTNEQIRAIVATGQYSDRKAEDWIVECLIKRRDKIGREHFARLLPLDRFAVSQGRLVFENLAVKHRFQKEPVYTVKWTIFDNERETHTEIRDASGFQLPAIRDPYIAAHIGARGASHGVVVYLRLHGETHEVVGIERTW